MQEFLNLRAGDRVRTRPHGPGKVVGRLVKPGGDLRVIVDHGERRLAGLETVPVVMSYPPAVVERDFQG